MFVSMAPAILPKLSIPYCATCGILWEEIK